MSTSRFGAVTDALVTLIDATSVTDVFDGPGNTAAALTEYVVVGGTDDENDDAGEFDQDWNGLGARTKQETGSVTCAVLVGTGDDEVKPARDRALAILAEIEDALRLDPSLGGVLEAGWAHMSSGRPSQRRNSNGLYVRVTFTVSYTTKHI